MTGAAQLGELEQIAQNYPLSLHSVGLSLGSLDLPDATHLDQLAALVARLQPGLVSDHLSWSAFNGVHLPDLLPLPYTVEAVAVVTRNVEFVQDRLKRRILLENPSQYLECAPGTFSEAQFLAEIVRRTGCGVLLDLNNIQVSACNRGGDTPPQRLREFLAVLPRESIGELHLAGHSIVSRDDGSTIRIDDHGSRVSSEVWDLFVVANSALGGRPTLIEWDTELPDFSVLEAEAEVAATILQETLVA